MGGQGGEEVWKNKQRGEFKWAEGCDAETEEERNEAERGDNDARSEGEMSKLRTKTD